MHSSRGLRPVAGAVAFGLALVGQTLTAATVTGDATEVGSDIRHPNGNIYDQVLLQGGSATVKADPGQIVRVSFIDLNDDIVQTEFSGSGALTISLAVVSGPMAPVKYHQPGVLYMRGAPTLVISGSDASTNVAIFSVGRANAVNQLIFRDGTEYDGVADVVLLQINADPLNPNGSTFGAIYAGNANFFGHRGRIGIVADRVQLQSLVRIRDITAFDDAIPYLQFGLHSQFGAVDVVGGDLQQPNRQPIRGDGYAYGINFLPGTDSHGRIQPAAAAGECRFLRNGQVFAIAIPIPG